VKGRRLLIIKITSSPNWTLTAWGDSSLTGHDFRECNIYSSNVVVTNNRRMPRHTCFIWSVAFDSSWSFEMELNTFVRPWRVGVYLVACAFWFFAWFALSARRWRRLYSSCTPHCLLTSRCYNSEDCCKNLSSNQRCLAAQDVAPVEQSSVCINTENKHSATSHLFG
jgi:hypothetical protein